jgi:hypothetical protein
MVGHPEVELPQAPERSTDELPVIRDSSYMRTGKDQRLRDVGPTGTVPIHFARLSGSCLHHRPRGINNYGDIVGAYRVPFAPRHAMLIRKGGYIPIAPTSILGVFSSEATNINDREDITGQMVDFDGFGHGFVVIDGVV